MPSTNATLTLRLNIEGTYNKLLHEIPIRSNGTNLWTQHPVADVAAMRISIPTASDVVKLRTEALSDDKFLEDFRIHPGDEVRVIGFPYGMEANNAGFPVLRSGRIASFPLTPTTRYPQFTIDFRVFPGNSGGPVYISETRSVEKNSLNTVSIRGILGLVSEEVKLAEPINTLTENTVRTYQLGLGLVVPSRFIIETIELLPPHSP